MGGAKYLIANIFLFLIFGKSITENTENMGRTPGCVISIPPGGNDTFCGKDYMVSNDMIFMEVGETCIPTCTNTKIDTYNLVSDCRYFKTIFTGEPIPPERCEDACKEKGGDIRCEEISLYKADCCSNYFGACDKSGEKYIRKCKEIIESDLKAYPVESFTCKNTHETYVYECIHAGGFQIKMGVGVLILFYILIIIY